MKEKKMSKTLTKFEKLKKAHQKIFPENFGIECGEGWIELIGILCKYFDNVLTSKDVVFIQFAQIKEKFGLLRVYFDLELPTPRKGIDPNKNFTQIHQTVSTMEEVSGIVCEDCGQMKHEGFDVKMRSLEGWRMTRCDKCFEAIKKRRKAEKK